MLGILKVIASQSVERRSIFSNTAPTHPYASWISYWHSRILTCRVIFFQLQMGSDNLDRRSVMAIEMALMTVKIFLHIGMTSLSPVT
jgi:hypothetical protein